MGEKEKEEDKMRLKEFFKPTKWKIIIFIILLIINTFLNTSGCEILSCKISNSIGFILNLPDKLFLSIPYFYTECYVSSLITENKCIPGVLTLRQATIFSLVSMFIFWYLISCLMVLIYNKSKLKNKKRTK